jgi:hypothetical protein
MLVPLEKEKEIYNNMYDIKRTKYATYFLVEFLGAGHQQEFFMDKKFVFRFNGIKERMEFEEQLKEQYG